MANKGKKPLELDGRTGEGGGQLVRVACALAALTSQPIRITHVRGNREGVRGGGLKAQHLSAIQWLATATNAQTDGVAIRSQTFEFRPSLPPTALTRRNIKIVADTPAASTLLIFQAVFPFLLFAGTEDDEPIELEIHGGTNVSWSLSYEYLDQVLLPTLKEQFDIHVERRLLARGWAQGGQRQGAVWFKIKPIRPGQTLKPARIQPSKENGHNQTGSTRAARPSPQLDRIDASLIVPSAIRPALQNAIAADLEALFPNIPVYFVVGEDSGHESRIYVLLVAQSAESSPDGRVCRRRRWGRDLNGFNGKTARKNMSAEQLSSLISKAACKDLYEELDRGGAVDEFLQDQLVVFQALAEGRTSFPREEEEEEKGGEELDEVILGTGDISLDDGDGEEGDGGMARMRKDKTHGPFGQGSMHTSTARWVASELIPKAQWFNRGSICDGGAVSVAAPHDFTTHGGD